MIDSRPIVSGNYAGEPLARLNYIRIPLFLFQSEHTKQHQFEINVHYEVDAFRLAEHKSL